MKVAQHFCFTTTKFTLMCNDKFLTYGFCCKTNITEKQNSNKSETEYLRIFRLVILQKMSQIHENYKAVKKCI